MVKFQGIGICAWQIAIMGIATVSNSQNTEIKVQVCSVAVKFGVVLLKAMNVPMSESSLHHVKLIQIHLVAKPFTYSYVLS